MRERERVRERVGSSINCTYQISREARLQLESGSSKNDDCFLGRRISPSLGENWWYVRHNTYSVNPVDSVKLCIVGLAPEHQDELSGIPLNYAPGRRQLR